MNATFYSNRLKSDALGYSAPPTPPSDPVLAGDPDAHRWLRLQDIIEHAKRGHFDGIQEVLDLYKSAETAVLQFVASRILGDVAPDECFESLMVELEQESMVDNPSRIVDYVNALVTWGSLRVVPVLLDVYSRLRRSGRKSTIPIHLSYMLEPDWGQISRDPSPSQLADYSNLVLSTYRETRGRWNTDDIYIFNGSQWSVISLARLIVTHAHDRAYDHIAKYEFRWRFEASTGIDCSPFYEDGRFQPLSAASIAEEFLESDAATNYEEGVRYFFGHRIPRTLHAPNS